MKKQQRIDIVNKIIKEIASRGRKFFSHGDRVSQIYIKNGRLYMNNAYSQKEMCLNTKYGYAPKTWSNGGTLWGLTKDFKDFIQTGLPSNHNNGYGGLYCPYWGYPESDMKAIQELATELNYLTNEQ